MGERKGTRGLELWCRRMTEGYPGVNVVNMTTSWRDGLAFCAIIHHFRPDLIDFSNLHKDNIYYNNDLAFRTAERHLGIPALLEPEDMVDFPVPDRLSILTYLSQFYQTFAVSQGKSPTRIPPKRPSTSPELPAVSPTSSSPPTKVASKARRDPCAKCGLPVFIAERLNVGKLLYHRTCFRCARCDSQLTLANYYKTEGDEYCCETCPDEEKTIVPSVLNRSVSDEEKSATLKNETDEYSTRFESVLENSRQFTKVRSFFLGEEPPDLPESAPPKLEDVSCETFDDSGLDQKTVQSGRFSGGAEPQANDPVTKETSPVESRAGSLVKARMQLFEAKQFRQPQEEEKDTATDGEAKEEARGDDQVQVPLDDSSSDSTKCSVEVAVEESPKEATNQDSAIDEDSIPIIEISDDTTPEVITIDTTQEELVSPENTPSEVIVKEEPRPQPEDYPEDLDPFKDDDPHEVSLNPFDDDPDPNPFEEKPPLAPRKKIQPSDDDKELSPLYIKRISENPFEEPPQPSMRKLKAPKVSLNPFWSDDDEGNEDEHKPVPKPRLSKVSEDTTRESGLKKRKPAPRPPTDSGASSLTSSPSQSVTHSPRSTPKIRKAKKAPLPPTSTPRSTPASFDVDISSLHGDFEQDKILKDEQNRNRQSQNFQSPSSSEASVSLGAPDKSTYGKWKRKKGQAPDRPIPQRRMIKSLPLVDIRRELELIEVQQQGLEKQGVRLERMIRERCEGPEVNPDEALGSEVEEMILQLFELVNEKNALFRSQATLMYLRRQHKLEEEHADIEYQIRCLMLQPEANKTDLDKAREEELISRLVEVVERRNEIIECLEMDRLREAEEDDGINSQLNLYNLKKEEDKNTLKGSKKEKKKQKKEKKKKGQKVDADKDIDESEDASAAKEKKKGKFYLF